MLRVCASLCAVSVSRGPPPWRMEVPPGLTVLASWIFVFILDLG